MVWPGDSVGRVSSRAGAGEPEQFADDAGVAHRPSGTRVERARRCPVLVVRPARAVGIGGRAGGEVVGEHAGEAEVFPLLHVPVARQGQDSRCPAAAAAVVPEPGPDAARQAAAGHGVPAPVGERGSAWADMPADALVLELLRVRRVGPWTAGAATADWTNDFAAYPCGDLAVRKWAARAAPSAAWPADEPGFHRHWRQVAGPHLADVTLLARVASRSLGTSRAAAAS